jgi:ribonuclease J
MRVKIHRGTHQIGGTAVELEFDGRRLVLDCGLPLDGDANDEKLLPHIAGLAEPDDSLLGVVLSHGHRDHWGMLPHAKAAPLVYMGEATEAILAAAAPFVPGIPAMKAAGHLVDGRPLHLGPFTVTPHLMCHSAFDAYGLTIDAGGRRLFYSGDFRGHGRKAALFERLIAKPPDDIHVMLMEGSSIGRLDPEARFASETEIEEALFKVVTSTSGMTLVAASAQNIDRVVSIFRATRRAGKTLVIDLYAAEILRATGRLSIPQTSWPDVSLFTPQHQRLKIKNEGLFPLLDRHKAGRVFPEDLAAEPNRFVLLFRAPMLGDLLRSGCLPGAQAIWSQWDGYLKDEYGKQTVERLRTAGVPLEVIHTSGHASIPDLKRLVAAIRPKTLTPIHTFEPERFVTLFENVVVRSDGEWWDV